jgi:hypothetical protein
MGVAYIWELVAMLRVTMKIKFFATVVALFTISTESWTQDNSEFKESVSTLQRIFDSDSSEFHFSLKDIDSLLIKKINALSDTLPYFPFTTSEAPYKRDMTIQPKKSKNTKKSMAKSTRKTFLADNEEDWRSGDHVPIGTEHLPTRKYLFGITNKSWTAIFYWHGGVGRHLHIVLTDNIKLTAFVTVEKGNTLGKAHYDGQLDKIKFYRLTEIMDIKDARYLNDKLMYDGGDIF